MRQGETIGDWWGRKAAELEAQASDPAYQAEQAKRRESAIRALEAQAGRAIRRHAETFGLPLKDIELAERGGARDTEATEALADPPLLLVLSGAAGCGKTSAAAIWLWRWVDERIRQEIAADPMRGVVPAFGGRALFVTAARLSRWSRYDDAEMSKLLRVHRLVVDDLGAEFMDERGSYLCLLDEVINERYGNRLTTVMTTNLEAAEFKARYGERIADRIRESGRFVSLSNPSMRRR